MMTESVSLLAVTSALYLLWRAFAHPSWSNQILAACAIGLASQIRLQALLLVPATILAVALFCLAERRLQPASRPGAPGDRALLHRSSAWLVASVLNGSPLGGYSSVVDTPAPGRHGSWNGPSGTSEHSRS